MLDHGDGNIDADGKAWVWVAAGSFFVLVSAATAILFRERAAVRASFSSSSRSSQRCWRS